MLPDDPAKNKYHYEVQDEYSCKTNNSNYNDFRHFTGIYIEDKNTAYFVLEI